MKFLFVKFSQKWYLSINSWLKCKSGTGFKLSTVKWKETFLFFNVVPYSSLFLTDDPCSQLLLLITGQYHGKVEVNKLKVLPIVMIPVHFGTLFYAIIP